MRLERLNNLPLNTVTPNFVALFVFLGTATSFIEKIETRGTGVAKSDVELFFIVHSKNPPKKIL